MTAIPRARDVVVALVLTVAAALVSVSLLLTHSGEGTQTATPGTSDEDDDELESDARPPIATGMDDAWAVAVGPDERLWVAGDREIQVRAADGALLARHPIAGRATCLAVGDARVYIGVTDHVVVIDAGDLGQLETWPSFGVHTRLTSMALSATGLWIADAGNARIGHFDTDGTFLGSIPAADDDPPTWTTSGHFAVPSPYFDVAVDGADRVLVANPGWHRVEVWTPDGESVGSWGWQSMEPEGFAGCCGPANLALFGSGEVVTCDKGLPRVKVYRSDGSLRSLVAGAARFAQHARACRGRTHGAVALDVAVDPQGRIVVLEPCTGRVRFLTTPVADDGSPP